MQRTCFRPKCRRNNHRNLLRQIRQLIAGLFHINQFRSPHSGQQTTSPGIPPEIQHLQNPFIPSAGSRQISHNYGSERGSFQYIPAFFKFRTVAQLHQPPGNRYFSFWSLGQRNPDRIPDTFIQQRPDSYGRTDPAVLSLSGFRHSQMQRIMHSFPFHFTDKQADSIHHHPAITGFQRNHHILEPDGFAHPQILHRSLCHSRRSIPVTAHNPV